MTLMEVKKTQPVAAAEPAVTGKKIARDFVGEIKDEIQKINWTDREELKAYTKIVVGATFACGIGIYCIDLLIQGVLGSLAFIVRLLGG